LNLYDKKIGIFTTKFKALYKAFTVPYIGMFNQRKNKLRKLFLNQTQTLLYLLDILNNFM